MDHIRLGEQQRRIVERRLMAQQMKREGYSLLDIAVKMGIAKSTASLYCRDVFYYPGRKYSTEAENRRTIYLRCIGKSHHSRGEKRDHHRSIQCKGCPRLIREGTVSGLCIDCYHQLRVRQAISRYNARPIRQPKPFKRPKNWVTPPPSLCPQSPTQAHFYVLDMLGKGACKYCPAVHLAGKVGTPR